MSYILEALKKSEQERGQGDTPGVQTIHTSSLQYHQQRRSPWPWILGAVILLNIAVLAWLVFGNRGEQESFATATVPGTPPVEVQRHAVVPETQPVSGPAPSVAPRHTAAPVMAPARSKTGARPVDAEPAVMQPVIAAAQDTKPVAVAARNNLPSPVSELLDLPTDVQNSIPEMIFSAHVYSSNPMQRSVVINGNFMEEGDMLNAEVRLDEITRDGVILDYLGTRFRSSVVSGWTVN